MQDNREAPTSAPAHSPSPPPRTPARYSPGTRPAFSLARGPLPALVEYRPGVPRAHRPPVPPM
eukprot:3946016-Pyramimonas_sp.AAC.1